MDAFFFTIAVFGFWAVLGRAVLTLCPTGLPALQQWLLAPAVGVSTLLLPVFWLNRAGWPVKDFGVGLVIGLALLSVLALWCKPPETPRKDLAIAGLILLGALLFAAWPMFLFGFAWVSFCNDDMANYCLAADRFLNHGYFEEPKIEDFIQGKDYTQAFWFMHAAGNVRAGSELILATACAFSGPKSAHHVFMPVIAALHMALISASGSIALSTQGSNTRAFCAMGLLAVSSLTVLGLLYQLIAQVGGLALLASGACLTLRVFKKPIHIKNFQFLIYLLPGAIIITSLTIIYPEVMPFYILGHALVLCFAFIHKKNITLKNFLTCNLTNVILVVILGNTYNASWISFLFYQGQHANTAALPETALFPYFLIPSGISKFWGVQGLNVLLTEPLASLVILFSMVGLLAFIILLPRLITNLHVGAIVLSPMLLVGFYLFYRNADFGLFKLAMFCQPFLWCGLVECKKFIKFKYIYYGFMAILIIGNLKTGTKYVIYSLGDQNTTSFASLNGASKSDLINNLKKLFEKNAIISKKINLFVCTPHIVLAKFVALYSTGTPTTFISRQPFDKIIKNYGLRNARPLVEMALKNRSECFLINGNSFYFDSSELQSNKEKAVFFEAVNELKLKNLTKTNAQPVLSEKPHLELIFRESNMGNHYYLGERDKIAVFQTEKDPFLAQRQFTAIGEHLLFQLLGQTNSCRVVLEITTTPLIQAGLNTLPNLMINSKPLLFVGNGAARLVSEPILFEKINGRNFLSIDISNQGVRFPNKRKGLQSLYGNMVKDDNRLITCFSRNIDILSEEEYHSFQTPSSVSKFPYDLENPYLVFSGIYEDGWISQNAIFLLKPGQGSKSLQISGFVPLIEQQKFKTVLAVKIDGVETLKKELGVGDFIIEIPVNDQNPKKIELSFTDFQKLPKGDGRPVGGKLNYIGFE